MPPSSPPEEVRALEGDLCSPPRASRRVLVPQSQGGTPASIQDARETLLSTILVEDVPSTFPASSGASMPCSGQQFTDGTGSPRRRPPSRRLVLAGTGTLQSVQDRVPSPDIATPLWFVRKTRGWSLSLLCITWSPHPRCVTTDGAALETARRRKETTYPELSGQFGRTKLVVLAAEVAGRWSEECRSFLSQLAKAKVRGEAPHLRARARQAWYSRWGTMLACSGGHGRLWPNRLWPILVF